MKKVNNKSKGDEESLKETLALLANKKLMKEIVISMEQYKRGKWKTLEQVEAELDYKNNN